MLYSLLAPYAEEFIAFNLFRYLTFRTGGAIMILAGGEAHVVVAPFRDTSKPATFERFGV